MAAPLAPFRMLVTGTRKTLTDDQRAFVRAKLRVSASTALGYGREVIVVNGQCHLGGVDMEAEAWANETAGCRPENHPAGRGQRLARNSEMVRRGADVCLAFPVTSSRGTFDCLIKAARAGIPGRVYPL
jgi:hypothetical protein